MIRELTLLAAGIHERLKAYLGYAPDPYLPWFGDGADGDLTVANGQTVIVTVDKSYRNVTVDQGGTLQVGSDGMQQWPTIRVSGVLNVSGTVRAGVMVRIYGSFPPRKTTAGAGSPGTTNNYTNTDALHAGRAGGSGAGGGDGTNAGGNGIYQASDVDSNAMTMIRTSNSTTNGTTGAGANGPASKTLNTHYFSYITCPRLPGGQAFASGSGTLLRAGGANYGGAGVSGGYGGGVLDLRVRSLVIGATGVIHADGGAGQSGEDGNAVNALGDIAGGGGGGAGGGGGTVCIAYRTLTNNGAIRASGGAGGAGGAGKEYTTGGPNQARATSNGGAGSAGSAGIVSLTRI